MRRPRELHLQPHGMRLLVTANPTHRQGAMPTDGGQAVALDA